MEEKAISRLSTKCSRCNNKDKCDNKKLEMCGFISNEIAQPSNQDASQPILKKHDYRNIQIAPPTDGATGTTITIDLEELKQKLNDKIYQRVFEYGC